MFSWGRFWRKIRPFVAIAVAIVFQQYELIPASIATQAGVSVGLANAVAGGLVAGAISGGSVQSVVTGGLTAGLFFGVGELGLPYLASVAAHGAVGCVSAALNGGQCGAGALSAGLAEAASPLIGAVAGPQVKGEINIGRLVGAAVVGGAGSAIGGDKFANGAVTAAFGYLFNQASHATGLAGENAWARAIQNEGGQVVGRNLKYVVVDHEGNAILRNGRLWTGEIDGLSRSRVGLYEVAEVKNGPDAKL